MLIETRISLVIIKYLYSIRILTREVTGTTTLKLSRIAARTILYIYDGI